MSKFLLVLVFYIIEFSYGIESYFEDYTNELNFYEKKEYSLAITYFSNAVLKNKDFYDGICFLGLSYYNILNYEKSIDCFKKINKVNMKDYTYVNYYLSICNFKSGNIEKSISNITIAVRNSDIEMFKKQAGYLYLYNAKRLQDDNLFLHPKSIINDRNVYKYKKSDNFYEIINQIFLEINCL